ncbi:hypothetical protein OIV19_22490 [Brucella sp. HL-2]|nr:hypothetical protein [Brucella sp. HL-2]MCV9910360.1 hypothetical protein [Brucella sp. HL-2]
MRFPGKRLIEGIGSWMQRKKPVSEDENSLTTKSKDEKLRVLGVQSQPATVSFKTAVRKNTHAEDDDALTSKMSEESAWESTVNTPSKSKKSNVSPFPVKASAHFTPEKKPVSPDQGPPPRPAAQTKNLETDDHLVTDSELAILQAENTRLKLLLDDQLKSSEDAVGN